MRSVPIIRVCVDAVGIVRRQSVECQVYFEAVPDVAHAYPLGPGHLTCVDHLIEQGCADADVDCRLAAREAALRWHLRHRGTGCIGQPFTTQSTIRAGGLTGTRATTLREVGAIGREARNCLRDPTRSGGWIDDVDIWAIRRDGKLVAVASVFRNRMIVELRGPGNSSDFRGVGHALVVWIAGSGFRIDRTVDIAIADLLGGPPRSPDPTGDDVAIALAINVARIIDAIDEVR